MSDARLRDGMHKRIDSDCNILAKADIFDIFIISNDFDVFVFVLT